MAAFVESISRLDAVKALPNNELFSTAEFTRESFLSYGERVRLSLKRAQAIVRAYNLTPHDVGTLSQPFWDLHADPIMAMDTSAGTLVTIQVNLFAGTLAKYIKNNPHLKLVLDDVLLFNILAHYCLSEVGHGLDAINIETTATVLPNGEFDFHTPHPRAAKIMPPTTPCGIPAVGVVFAQLVKDGQKLGIRPFLVNFNDGTNNAPGVTSRLLPPREGSPPVFHSITSFDHVRLPSYALLGSISPKRARTEYLDTIWRTAVGALALGSGCMPAISRSAFITGRYSQRRTVGDARDPTKRVPILHFRTQHGPILSVLAQSFVVKAFWRVATKEFVDPTVDMAVRQAWATVFKATLVDLSQRATIQLAMRCGGQGLFAHNAIISQHSSILGLSIAEGDVLGLCIRLASELLLGRYALPAAKDPHSLLAQHEAAIQAECRDILSKMSSHRSSEFNARILPKAELIVRSIGHRMAYEAAVAEGLDERITNMFLASVVRMHEGWYVESGACSRRQLDELENAAIQRALPCIDEWLEMTAVEKYAQVPILTQENWDQFVSQLPTVVGEKTETEIIERQVGGGESRMVLAKL